MGVIVSGAVGQVRWGYLPAGTLRAWTMTRDEAGIALTARIEQTDTFRISQHPLVFVAPHVKGAWTWPIQSLQIQGDVLSARLGPQKA